MNYLAENALPIWIGGAFLVFLALVTYLNLRTTKSLLLIPATVALVAALLLTEWFVETPREAVRRTLYEMADAIEADDLQGTLAFVSPSAAEVRTDAETLMPLVTVEKANVVDVPSIDVNMAANPPEAVVLVRGFIDCTLKQNGMRQPILDPLHVTFVLENDRWLVKEYTPSERLTDEWERYRNR